MMVGGDGLQARMDPCCSFAEICGDASPQLRAASSSDYYKLTMQQQQQHDASSKILEDTRSYF